MGCMFTANFLDYLIILACRSVHDAETLFSYPNQLNHHEILFDIRVMPEKLHLHHSNLYISR